MMLMVWGAHFEDHGCVKWVVLNFVTAENLGKRGPLTEGEIGRGQTPVMETQTLCMACAMCHSMSHLTARPLPFSESADSSLRISTLGPAHWMFRGFPGSGPISAVPGLGPHLTHEVLVLECLLFGPLWQLCTLTLT